MAGRKKKPAPRMWLRYQVELQMTGRFAASLPKTGEEIVAMLEHRKPVNPPENWQVLAR